MFLEQHSDSVVLWKCRIVVSEKKLFSYRIIRRFELRRTVFESKTSRLGINFIHYLEWAVQLLLPLVGIEAVVKLELG